MNVTERGEGLRYPLRTMSRASNGLARPLRYLTAVVTTGIVIGAVMLTRPSGAQTCNRQCDSSRRDANGCCPADTPTKPATPAACPSGQTRTVDTAGHCCWPGQAWSGSQCLGRPTECPQGYVPAPASCELPACVDGRMRMADGIHCCWAGQAWASSRSTCVGAPTCPTGSIVQGETCVVPPPPAASPPPPQPPPAGTPAKPTQGAVTIAISGALPQARACLKPDDPISRANVTFASAGSVVAVVVTGGAAGTAAADCIKVALWKAAVPPFSEPTYAANVTVRPN